MSNSFHHRYRKVLSRLVAEVSVTSFKFSTTSINRGQLKVALGLESFLHAFAECDTIAASFCHGKTKLWSRMQKHPPLVRVAFPKQNTIHEVITEAESK